MDSESISTKQRLCPCDPPGIQAASSSGGCSSPPLSHLLGRRSLPHKVCNCADGIKLKSYQRKSYALGIHQASKQPPLQETVQALPSPTSSAGGHSLTNFETVLMDSESISVSISISVSVPISISSSIFSIVLMPHIFLFQLQFQFPFQFFEGATTDTYHHNN